MEDKVRTFKSVGIIMFFTILSSVFACLLQILLAYLYGARSEMDVYFLALAIPLFISGLITSTMAVVFIPLFRGFIVKNNEEGLWDFINNVFNYLVLGLLAITAILFFCSSFIISSVASGFSPEKKILAVSLLKILSFSIIPMQLFTLLIVIYYSKESFFKPVFVRLLNPLGIIISVLLFNRLLGIKSLAYGFVIASLIQFLIMLYFLKRQSCGLRFSFSFNRLKVEKVWQMTLIVMAGIFIFGLIDPLEKFLASNLAGGSVSYLGYAERIFYILILLPNMAVPLVILPQLSGHYAINDIAKLRSTFSTGIRSTLFITLPLVVTLFIFRQPLISLFLQRGAFDQQATINTALGLVCYLGVFFESERLVILNTLYSMRDVMTPFFVGIITFILYILIAIPLSATISFAGLALAHSIAYLVYNAINMLVLRAKLGFIDGRRIATSASKMAISAVGSGAIMFLIFNNIPSSLILLKLSFSLLIGLITYLAICFLLRLEDLYQFYKVIVKYKQQLFLRAALEDKI